MERLFAVVCSLCRMHNHSYDRAMTNFLPLLLEIRLSTPLEMEVKAWVRTDPCICLVQTAVLEDHRLELISSVNQDPKCHPLSQRTEEINSKLTLEGPTPLIPCFLVVGCFLKVLVRLQNHPPILCSASDRLLFLILVHFYCLLRCRCQPVSMRSPPPTTRSVIWTIPLLRAVPLSLPSHLDY